ncbi:SDR family oxidoreductase [Sphingomonas sp. PB4P5]|uniref:SDR family oxidoreductase n=1 Tax=Parasphingomonas puruogangriensis TaxID=3096155 RepID=UPI002FCB9FD4
MRIFLTGATGFVGSAIVSDLVAAGHQVVGLARSEEAVRTLAKAGAEAYRGDLDDPASLRAGTAAADAVIHAAFDHDFARLAESSEMDRLAIEAIGDALVGSDKRFIVTSGLPPVFGRVATEDDLPPADGHGMPRRSEQAARALVERGVQAMVIRMPQVHDRVKQGFATYLLAHAREKGVSAYVGDGANRWPAVHRLDAARLYGLVLEHGVAGRSYHAVAEQGVRVRAIAEAIGDRLKVPVMALSEADAAGHFGWLERIARMDVPASSLATQEALGWQSAEPHDMLDDIRNSA